MSDVAPIGSPEVYNEFLAVLDRRMAAKGITRKMMDEICQFPDGLTGKLHGPAQVKRYNAFQLFDALRGVGLRMVLVEDPQWTLALADQEARRHAEQARSGHHPGPAGKAMQRRVFKQFARSGGRARMRKMTKRERTELALRANAARWGHRYSPSKPRRWKGNRPAGRPQ